MQSLLIPLLFPVIERESTCVSTLFSFSFSNYLLSYSSIHSLFGSNEVKEQMKLQTSLFTPFSMNISSIFYFRLLSRLLFERECVCMCVIRFTSQKWARMKILVQWLGEAWNQERERERKRKLKRKERWEKGEKERKWENEWVEGKDKKERKMNIELCINFFHASSFIHSGCCPIMFERVNEWLHIKRGRRSRGVYLGKPTTTLWYI